MEAVEAGNHDLLVFGSMWNTWALHEKIGCSLKSIPKTMKQDDIKVKHINMDPTEVFLFKDFVLRKIYR